MAFIIEVEGPLNTDAYPILNGHLLLLNLLLESRRLFDRRVHSDGSLLSHAAKEEITSWERLG